MTAEKLPRVKNQGIATEIFSLELPTSGLGGRLRPKQGGESGVPLPRLLLGQRRAETWRAVSGSASTEDPSALSAVTFQPGGRTATTTTMTAGFPVPVSQTCVLINEQPTFVAVSEFRDRSLVSVSQRGLGCWISASIDAMLPGSAERTFSVQSVAGGQHEEFELLARRIVQTAAKPVLLSIGLSGETMRLLKDGRHPEIVRTLEKTILELTEPSQSRSPEHVDLTE